VPLPVVRLYDGCLATSAEVSLWPRVLYRVHGLRCDVTSIRFSLCTIQGVQMFRSEFRVHHGSQRGDHVQSANAERTNPVCSHAQNPASSPRQSGPRTVADIFAKSLGGCRSRMQSIRPVDASILGRQHSHNPILQSTWRFCLLSR
jgi:hypothetical protein